MHYAASLALQKGYLAFAILDEDGTGESGTTFSWNLGYTPSRRHGLLVFQPGKFFTVIFRTKRPSDSDGWFDAVEELGNRKPK